MPCGTSETYPDIKYYYDSTRGGILESTETCTPLPAGGGSFTDVLATKKALIVAVWGSTSVNTVTNFLTAKGFGTVDYKDNPPVSEYEGYDVIVLIGANGTIRSGNAYANLLEGYNKGYKILTDGNDSTKYSMPFIKDSTLVNNSTTSFNQTGASSLSPSFPYTYKEPTFNPDSAWVCPTSMIPEMIVLTTGPNPNPAGADCITASAMSSGQGRWIHLLQAPLNTQKGITSDALDWLMM